MGAPELPNDPVEDLHTTDIIHHAPTPSDDSDNDSLPDAAYDGYQPLSMEDNSTDYGYVRANVEGDENNAYTNSLFVNRIQNGGNESEQESRDDHNIPQIEAVDVEIQREVWSQPRPQELQIELDGNKTQLILNAMANFQLPNIAVPDWAEGVPEDRWKEELLQRIRQRKSTAEITNINVEGDTQ